MLFTTFQSVIVSKNRFLSYILFCFFISINSQAQNLLALNNNPGFEGTGGFQANGYTNISPGTSGTSVPSNYAITGDSGPMNLTSFKSVTPHSGTKMMVVDANNQIFWQGNPNIQLIGGVTYTFSYWIVNVNKNSTINPAVINFAAVDQCGCTPVLISGSPTVNNGAWQQVVYQFTPSGTGAKWVRFELSTPGATASGNDFAIDDISLYEPPKPITLSYTKSDITCPSDNDGIIIGYAGWGVPPYTFKLTGPTGDLNSTTGIFSGLEIGSYTLTVSDSQTIPDGKTITPITLVTPLDVSVVSDAGTCLTSGSLVKLTASNAGPIYTWKDSSGAILGTGNPFSVNPIATSTYTVESTSTTIIPASNLITNGDFESGNVGFKSDYGFYAGNTSGAQKAYGIQSDPSVSFTSFEKCGDKTFGSGLMMVVDGATDGTSVVWSQIVHVESNTNYDFFFHVQNLTPSNKATFSVTIGGTPITLTTVSATNSGSAAPAGCGWTQIKGTWPSGLVTPNPEIKIIDTKTNSAGNDFGIDDITFIAQTPTSKTCNLSKDITVNINPTLTPTINCGTSTTSSVQFTWATVSNATDYSVSYKINTSPTVTIGSIGNVLDYTVNGLTSGDNVTITLTPIGGAGTCFTSNTQMCTASNCIPPTATISYASSPFCISNTTPQPVTLTGTGAYTTGTYSAVGLIINSLTGSITPSANTSGPYTVTYTIPASGGCSQVKTTTPISISPQPDSGTDGGISVCEDDTTAINLSNLITGEQAGGVWTRTTGSGGTFNTAAGTFTPAAGATTSTFTYTLNSTPCSDSSIATVTVNAVPVLTITCGTPSSSSVTFNWNSIADATNYNYSYSIESGAPISGNLPSSATTLTVNGLTPGQNVAITLIPTGSVCGKQAIFNCTSSNCPSPIVDVISDFPSCANDNVTIPNFTSVTSPVTFKWTNTNTSIGIAANGTGAIIPTFKALNSTTVLQTATISVTADDGTCKGPEMKFNIDVYPLPTVTISAAKPSVCSGSATTINFNGTPKTTVTYTINSGTSQFLVLDDSGNATLDTGNLSTKTDYKLLKIENPLTSCSQTQFAIDTATVSINPLPTVVISGTTPICSGSGTSIQFNNGTPNAIVTYTINSGTVQTIDLDATGEATLPTGNLTTNTVYNLVSVLNTTTTCSQTLSGNAAITVDPLPTVIINATKSLVCSGSGTTIVFSGTSNARVTYTINSGTIQTIDLDSTGKASIGTGNLTSNAIYSLVNVQDLSSTCFQTKSETATVTIISLPTATISGTTPICSGSGTSITFNGTPNATVTYTINSGINQTINLDATGKADLLTGNLITNTDYNLVSVEDSTKTCSQTLSEIATVSINPLPTVVISTSSPICSGSSTKVEFKGTPNAKVTYKVNSGANQTINLDAFGDATLLTGNLISNTIYILVSVSDAVTSCSQPQSGTATVTITPLPKVTISGTTAICSGASSSITFTGTPNATVTYTVNSGIDETIDLDATGKAILPTGILITNTNYSLVSIFDSSTTCSQTQSGTATVSISVAPDVIPSTTNQPICSGQSSGILLSSSISGTVFSWTVSQSGVTGASNDTGNVISQVLTSGINVGTADYTITPTANGCSGSPVVVTVTVSPAPTVIASPNTDSICSGTSTAIALSSNSSQTTFDWNVIQNNVSGAIQGSGNTIVQELKTTLNNIGEAVYSITPTLNGCSGPSILVPVTVNPVPVASASVFQNPICSGNATKIDLTSNVAGTTFTWSVIQTNVIGAVPGSGNTIAQTLSTSGIIMGTADYTITPQINSCIGSPIKVSIQVNPTPEVFGFSETTICSGDSPKISLKPIISGTTFSWTALPTGVTGSIDGDGDTIDQILIAENNPGKVIYTVTPELNGCTGNSIMITVNVDPSPSLNLENGVICLEIDGTLKKSLILDTNLSDSLYNFEWYFKDSLISGAVNSSYEVEELGEYYVKVTNTVTGCSLKSNISTVSEVNPTNSFDIIVSDAFTENASITVTGQNGVTTYLYQIDNGAQQTSNVFTGIGGGLYTIRITDSDGCTDYSEEVLVIDYPKYFTPNGDGFNDTWNIKGLSNQPNASLLIFDRYGKLLKQISPKGQGWDGTFNGTQLPATDYWFTVDYTEPKTDINKLFKAHFSLKR